MKKVDRMQPKLLATSQDAKNNFEVINSLEVISGGNLSDIARPSISRGSTRSQSQLSFQSFELETLPDEKDVPNYRSNNDSLVVEESPTFDGEASSESKVSLFFSMNEENKNNTGSVPQKFSWQSEDKMSANDFEKEVRKISKRVVRSKKRSVEQARNSKDFQTSFKEESTEGIERPQESVVEEISENEKEKEDIKESEEKKEDIDPKIKRGLEKIKKLDNILADKIKIEKEVKADRKRMEKEWQLEIKSFIEWCGDNKSKPGIQQFLALTEGITGEERFDYIQTEDDFVPLFPTEIDTGEDDNTPNAENSEEGDAMPNQGGNLPEANNDKNTKSSESNEMSKRKKKRNFLKRNIELAGHANEIIALTEQERLRLDDLLADDSDLLLFENPFAKNPKAVALTGYELDENSKRALNDIDEKLRMLVPEPDYDSICSTPFSDQRTISHRTLVFSQDGAINDDDTKCKEPALQEGKDFRDMKLRLQEIEAELGKIDQLKEEDFESETPRISHELLRQLLDVDDRLTSSRLSILDSCNNPTPDISLSPTHIEEGEFVLDSFRSTCSDKSFCSVGV